MPLALRYDTLVTNPSGYEGSGDSVYLEAGNNIFPNLASKSVVTTRDSLTAIIGRLSQYTANLVYDRSGKPGSWDWRCAQL